MPSLPEARVVRDELEPRERPPSPPRRDTERRGRSITWRQALFGRVAAQAYWIGAALVSWIYVAAGALNAKRVDGAPPWLAQIIAGAVFIGLLLHQAIRARRAPRTDDENLPMRARLLVAPAFAIVGAVIGLVA